jgi:hypothetical protein
MFSRLCLLLSLLIGAGAAADELFPQGPLFLGYYQAWQELPVGTARAMKLAQMPGSLDILAIGFAKPDLSFDGAGLKGTGLEFPPEIDLAMVRKALDLLRAKTPKLKILITVGGESYTPGWLNYKPADLARLVKALGADGVDLDYEPAHPGCARRASDKGGGIFCASETDWARLITATRAVLPRPAILIAPAWSVGAYGEGDFARDVPTSQYTGSMQWLKRAPEARELDMVTVLAYDAGPAFDPERAFAAYRALWDGPLLLGLTVPGDKSRELPMTLDQLKHHAQLHAQDRQGGILLYAVTEEFADGPSEKRPDGGIAAKAICEGLGRSPCP